MQDAMHAKTSASDIRQFKDRRSCGSLVHAHRIANSGEREISRRREVECIGTVTVEICMHGGHRIIRSKLAETRPIRLTIFDNAIYFALTTR